MTEECSLKENGYKYYVASDNFSFKIMVFFSTALNQSTWIKKETVVIENTYLQKTTSIFGQARKAISKNGHSEQCHRRNE